MNENDIREESVRDSNPPLLRWTAAVMRQWGDVFDRFNRQTRCVYRRYGTITTCTRPLDLHFNFLDTKLTGCIGYSLGCTLSGKRCTFAAALKTNRAGTGPAKGITIGIRNCHQRVVECRLDVNNSSADITPRFALLGLGHV